MRGTQVLGQGTQVSGQGAQEPGYSMLPSTDLGAQGSKLDSTKSLGSWEDRTMKPKLQARQLHGA